jgi:hypothetical protein
MDIFRIYFELLSLLQMPWEVLAFIFITSLFIYWLLRGARWLFVLLAKVGVKITEWMVKLFLLPEYLFTSFFRLLHIKSVPGTEAYDNAIVGAGGAIAKFLGNAQNIKHKKMRFPFWWIILILVIVVAAWFLQFLPSLRGTTTLRYIQKVFNLYLSLKHYFVK